MANTNKETKARKENFAFRFQSEALRKNPLANCDGFRKDSAISLSLILLLASKSAMKIAAIEKKLRDAGRSANVDGRLRAIGHHAPYLLDANGKHKPMELVYSDNGLSVQLIGKKADKPQASTKKPAKTIASKPIGEAQAPATSSLGVAQAIRAQASEPIIEATS